MTKGLPVSVTLSLLIIALRMKKHRVLVKNLTVIETLSCVNVIASDKTGTLTQNKMFAASAVVGASDEINLDAAELTRSQGFNQLVSAAGLCNNASFDPDEEPNVPVRQRKAKGDATDIALLRFAAENQLIIDFNSNYTVDAEIPFNSRNKWMVKVIRAHNRDIHKQAFGPEVDFDSNICLLKGAPDYLLKKSTHIIRTDGSKVLIDGDIQNRLISSQNDLCLLGNVRIFDTFLNYYN